jgi:uncharacterized SAM-binding protein YcdF (DUF218 family)
VQAVTGNRYDQGTGNKRLSWLHSVLYRLFEGLTRNDPVQPVDLVFVLAGRLERKAYGLELYRAGGAPRLLLSVGRFEVSKMPAVDFEGAAELIAERDRTAPGERHFFCELSAAGVHIETVRLRKWNTYGEMLGLRAYLERDMPRSVMIVSTDVHLRRAALAFERVFRDTPVEARYCPVSPGNSSVRKERWWTRPADRKFVVKEIVKLAGYRAILTMPDWAIERLMKLKG